LIGFAAYTWLLRVAPTPLVSTYAYVNPIVAILLGHLMAGEFLTPRIPDGDRHHYRIGGPDNDEPSGLAKSGIGRPKSTTLLDD